MGFFRGTILGICANAGIFWALEQKIFPEKFAIDGGIFAYFFVSIIFGILNASIFPFLKIIALPLRFLTLGIFSIFLNGILLKILQHSVNFLDFGGVALRIENWTIAVAAGFILAATNSFLHWFLR